MVIYLEERGKDAVLQHGMERRNTPPCAGYSMERNPPLTRRFAGLEGSF